ncbi:aldehyde dehydrogenase [Paraburkholderia fungorum]|uniref:aldehyde dehydrogenase n=1 Tax=Paraburkholderia fungorum TaxID=134537 RepID=UPI0038B81B60
MSIKSFHNYYGGREAAARSGQTFTSENPTTGLQWGTFPLSDAADVDAAARAADSAFNGKWGTLSHSARGRLMMKLGDLIGEHAERLAELDTAQNGRLHFEVTAQIRATQGWMYYYGGLADKIEGSVIPLDQTSVLNYTLREALGVVGVIVPWNSPIFLTVMSIAPALAAGNTILIKPSEVTSASAIELAKLADEAGLPPGVINVVTGMREVGEALVAHPLVKKICFTGSDQAGRAIAARAGERLVSCTLELGGKSPNIVFDDVNLDQAETGILAGIFAAAGQTCIAGSRAYVHASIYDELVERLVARTRKIRLGDPMVTATQMGPIATAAQLKKNRDMVARAADAGAEILCGGDLADVPGLPHGFFFQPTILQHASASSELMQSEVFGPVLAITPFKEFEEVAGMANDTAYGLGAGIWTRDIKRAHLLARRIKAGTVWVNTYRAMSYSSPFGGMKASGIGRQNGIEAINQYLQTKSVWCELGDEIADPFMMKV